MLSRWLHNYLRKDTVISNNITDEIGEMLTTIVELDLTLF